MVKLIPPLLCIAISGCSLGNVEKDFLCAAEDGLPCRSISEVDGGSASGEAVLEENALDTRNKTLSDLPLFGGKGKNAVVATLPSGGVPYGSERYRIPEKTARLWIAPYHDDSEILHEGTFVHFVLSEATWGQR